MSQPADPPLGNFTRIVMEANNIEDIFIREVRVNYVMTSTKQFTIRNPDDVARFFREHAVDNSREQFMGLFLNGNHCVAAYSIISIGNENSAPVQPSILFQRALLAGCVSIAIAHNHPSNNLQPSPEDLKLTRRLFQAADLLGIKMLDHVIVSDTSDVSLKETHSSIFRAECTDLCTCAWKNI